MGAPVEHGLTPEQYLVNLDAPYQGLGLARLKTEGERFVYDTGAGPPGPPLTAWQRRRRQLAALAQRLRDTPGRVWWALFGGDDYYDDGGW